MGHPRTASNQDMAWEEPQGVGEGPWGSGSNNNNNIKESYIIGLLLWVPILAV